MSSMGYNPNPKFAEAQERAKARAYVLVRVSDQRYAIVQLSSTGARGVVGGEPYGYRTGSIVKGCERLTFDAAHDVLRRIDHENFRPEDG